MSKLTHDEWKQQAEALFGKNSKDWTFVCPVCGTEQSIRTFEEYTDLTPDEIVGVIGFACIGRDARHGVAFLWDQANEERHPDAIGCLYTSGGFFNLNPVEVEFNEETHRLFPFAEVDVESQPDALNP